MTSIEALDQQRLTRIRVTTVQQGLSREHSPSWPNRIYAIEETSPRTRVTQRNAHRYTVVGRCDELVVIPEEERALRDLEVLRRETLPHELEERLADQQQRLLNARREIRVSREKERARALLVFQVPGRRRRRRRRRRASRECDSRGRARARARARKRRVFNTKKEGAALIGNVLKYVAEEFEDFLELVHEEDLFLGGGPGPVFDESVEDGHGGVGVLLDELDDAVGELLVVERDALGDVEGDERALEELEVLSFERDGEAVDD